MSSRPNTGHVVSKLSDLDVRLTTNLTEVLKSLDTLQHTVDSILISSTEEANMASAQPQHIDLSQIQQMLASAGSSKPSNIAEEINKALDAKTDALVSRVLEAQEANKSFWTSPVFLGCVAGGVLLIIGGTLYYMNQRLNTLEEISVK